MIGHLQILEARENRRKPVAIFFELGVPAKPVFVKCGPARRAFREALYNPEAAMGSGMFPVVYVEPGEHPDLRFVRDCQTHLSAPAWSPALIALGEALADAGASLVVVNALAESPDLMIFEGGEWRAE